MCKKITSCCKFESKYNLNRFKDFFYTGNYFKLKKAMGENNATHFCACIEQLGVIMIDITKNILRVYPNYTIPSLFSCDCFCYKYTFTQSDFADFVKSLHIVNDDTIKRILLR